MGLTRIRISKAVLKNVKRNRTHRHSCRFCTRYLWFCEEIELDLSLR
jgi:hypothetical protein